MSTEIEFGDQLFPDVDRSTLTSGRVWAKVFCNTPEDLISQDELDGRKAEYEAKVKQYEIDKEAWDKLSKEEQKGKMGPWLSAYCDPTRDYEPFDPSTVYYDDIAKMVADEIKRHNRLALVLQGLLDRSPILHPHPPWQIWKPEDFSEALGLVYDDSRVLTDGEKPDFFDYRQRLNRSLKTGSVTVGQQVKWEIEQAEKENARQERDWRIRNPSYYKRFKPSGNPGPGKLTVVEKFQKKARRCKYAWMRERKRGVYDVPVGQTMYPAIQTSWFCHECEVMNVDAYKPGDFRQFFNDPRTRAEYLKWAPFLLIAEEYHAGNLKPNSLAQSIAQKEDLEW